MDMLYSFHQNFSETTFAVAVVMVALSIFVFSKTFYLRGPGPWGIPILGFYPFLRQDYALQLTELSKKYGDAYLFSMHCKLYLHLSSAKAVREAFVTKAECFQGRSEDFSLFQYVFKDGLPFAKGEAWNVLHKFLLQSMRELGLGPKEQLKNSLYDSIQDTLTKLTETKGQQPVDIMELLTTQCTEVVRNLVIGKNVSLETVRKLNQVYFTAIAPMDKVGILLCGNVARYLAAPRLKGFSEVFKAKKELDKILQIILDEHRANFDMENPEDLMDLYLREKKMKEEKGDPQVKYLTDKSFLATLLLAYGDGGSTTGAILSSYLMHLSKMIDIQDTIYEEIVREIGTERLATYEDRDKLPFTNAVIKELERQITLVPVVPSLECSRETTVSGVLVPKGTLVLFNAYAIHNDPAVYKNPERFDPQRFMLDPETKRPKEKLPMLFGIGRRSCSGEQLVTTEIFMFLTALMQHFTLKFDKSNSSENSQEGAFQEIMSLRVFAIPRKHS